MCIFNIFNEDNQVGIQSNFYSSKKIELTDQTIAKSVTGVLCKVNTGSRAYGLIDEINFKKELKQIPSNLNLTPEIQDQLNSKPLYFYHSELREYDLTHEMFNKVNHEIPGVANGIELKFDIICLAINNRFVAKNVWLTDSSKKNLEKAKQDDRILRNNASRLKNAEIGHFLKNSRTDFISTTDARSDFPVKTLVKSNSSGKICDISYDFGYGHVLLNSEKVFFCENSLVGTTTKSLELGDQVIFDLCSRIKNDEAHGKRTLNFAESVRKTFPLDDVESGCEVFNSKIEQMQQKASENPNCILYLPKTDVHRNLLLPGVDEKFSEARGRRSSSTFLKVDDAGDDSRRSRRNSRRCSTSLSRD